MITAMHALLYTDDPAKTRAFSRDVLQWPHSRSRAMTCAPRWPSCAAWRGVHPRGARRRVRHHDRPRRPRLGADTAALPPRLRPAGTQPL